MLQGLVTCEQFLAMRFDLPEAGQWAELDEGLTVLNDPPDIDHGNALLNLSKAFADYIQTESSGYPCFDLGLLTARRPDTVRFPAISYFFGGERFFESDKTVTETVPRLIIELASTKRRRHEMTKRISQYLAWGVSAVWVIDPCQKTVQIHQHQQAAQLLTTAEFLEGGPWLTGFRMAVADLFVEPKWWTDVG